MAASDPTPWGRYLDFLHEVGLPANMVTASLTVVVGLVAAFVFRALARRLVHRGAKLLAGWSRLAPVTDTKRLEAVVGSAVYWGVLTISVMAATETLGLRVVTGWLGQFASYLPRVVAAILILALGTILARVAGQLVSKAAGATHAPIAQRLGRVTEVMLLVAAVLVAVEQLGIEVSFLKTTLLVLLAAAVGGAALAFGLGGRDLVANVLSAHFIQRIYQPGQVLRIEGVEGRIVRITEMAVIIEGQDGEVVIPASQLARERSEMVFKRGAK